MADRIRLLPEVVANQIAAGEVVNRPSSVVKEMMENAIDAGARCVTVNAREGGKELIQVVDDGCGMSPMDARMAFDRHATSKIAAVEDIYRLSTFGFRGEALASIAAVSEVELRTRQPESETGTVTRVEGGRFVGQESTLCPVGSQFRVKNLFYNVPARRRFLDKSTSSARQIREEFQRVALCNPQIAFNLLNNDAPVYSLAPASLAGRIVDVIGRHIKPNLLEVSADTSIVRIEGFVGRPAAAKKSNAEQFFFVNGRYFSEPYFRKAILKAYEKLIPDTCFPSYFIYLTIDPGQIDVNVHPQKTEVKFAERDAVWQIINAAVRETLAKTGAVPLMDFEAEGRIDIPVMRRGAVYDEPRAMSNASYNPFAEEYTREVADSGLQRDVMPDLDVPYDDTLPARGGSGRGRKRAAAPLFPRPGTEIADIPSAGFGGEEEIPSGGFGGGNFGERTSFAADFDAEQLPHGSADRQVAMPEGAADGMRAAGWRTVAASDEPLTPVASDAFGGEEFEEYASSLDFVESEAAPVQQRLLADELQGFAAVTAVGGGLAVALWGGRLVVADLRRARERVLYECYMKGPCGAAAVSQQLLFPERLVLSLDEYALMEQHAGEFAALGFDVAYAGDGAIDVRGVPADMPAESVDRLVYELLQVVGEPLAADLRRERLALCMARSGAAPMARCTSSEQAARLLDELAATGNVSFSPSGKAILAELTPGELRKKLG